LLAGALAAGFLVVVAGPIIALGLTIAALGAVGL